MTGPSCATIEISTGATQPGPSASWTSSCCWRAALSGESWATDPTSLLSEKASAVQTKRKTTIAATTPGLAESRWPQRAVAPWRPARRGRVQRSSRGPSRVSIAGATIRAEITLSTEATEIVIATDWISELGTV